MAVFGVEERAREKRRGVDDERQRKKKKVERHHSTTSVLRLARLVARALRGGSSAL